MSVLSQNYEQVARRIEQATRRAGGGAQSVRLVAVSKGRSADEVAELWQLGQTAFGENRVEEAAAKIAALNRAGGQSTIEWHMVGHVQRRKAREVAAHFQWVHSADSVPLIERLNRTAGTSVAVLLECNVSGEQSKYGFAAHRIDADDGQWPALCAAAEAVLQQPRLQWRGLMTMAPIVTDPEQTRPVFRALRRLRDKLAQQFPSAQLTELSMGMTDDFEVAIEEGSTMVRVGRAIFEPLT